MKLKIFIKRFIPGFLLSFYHYCLALIGAVIYGFPSRKLKVIGVTGTSGKSTVVELTAKILQEAGFRTASLSSIGLNINSKNEKNRLKMTMPGRLKVQKFLKRTINSRCSHVVLEVTSEGIKQFRHKFIDFDIAVFTNLSPEHIESHGGFKKYKAVKGSFFRTVKDIHIINIDDKNAEYFLKIPAKKKINYSRNEFDLIPKDFKLFGEFNLYNALAAIKVGMSQGVSLDICQKALRNIEIMPGRMELVIKEPFQVIVDYAHTPEALEQVYRTIKSSRLICVLGSCGGGRDKWKRPVLGKIADQYCDKVIITNEDPYDEDPMGIVNQVADGSGKAEKILDRKEAIRRALQSAQLGDTVIITGKGSEPWMCVARGKKIPWDDRKIVKEEMRG